MRKGQRHTQESRDKVSASKRGSVLSEETRRKLSLSKKGKRLGSENHRWKGGRTELGGYILVYCPEHPFAICRKNYVFEHRLVMEKFLGRLLRHDEDVHHIDGNKKNNALENLRVISHSEHTRLHHEQNRRKKEDAN